MTGLIDIVPVHPAVPALVAAAGGRARERFLEFFAARIRNKHTRRAYAQATREFLAWCEAAGVASIAEVRPLHVALYIEQLGRERLAADRQAAPRRGEAFVRLARYRAGRAGESGGVGPWAVPQREAG